MMGLAEYRFCHLVTFEVISVNIFVLQFLLFYVLGAFCYVYNLLFWFWNF